MFANHRSRIRGRFGNFANGYMLIDGSRPVHDTSPGALGEVSIASNAPVGSRQRRATHTEGLAMAG